MPFLKVKVSCPISAEQEAAIKARIGKAIELVPGKSEAYLLLAFADNAHLWLRGEHAEPIAYIEAAVFGNESHAGYPAFSAELARIFQDVLGIAPENLYIKYEDISAWSVSGQYIDRSMFR
ncbi:MAG: hypothetical protein IJ112_08115 [Oscillospiraceae bacterium]|nr:hypothetical protein [Oscillospiraceae bacterium]